MKYNRKIHFNERQLRDLSGLTIDALRVRAKTDPKFPEVLFVSEAHQMVCDKKEAQKWLSWMHDHQKKKLEVVPPRRAKPLSQHGEYKPSPAMRINLERTKKLYPHRLVTPKGIGNNANLGGRYDA